MAKQLPKRDLENVGLCVTGACVALVTLVVAALIFMVAQKGLSAFVKDGVSVVEFFTGTKWDLANTAKNGLPYTGALPLIVTSFAVMVLSTLIALPIAIGSAIFAVEIQPKFGSKIFQPLIELLTGIPSVVFGLIGFHVVVGLMKSVFHASTGLGILPGFGGTQRLARLVGMGMAKQLVYSALNIKADEAYRIGLVNAVYPQAELMENVLKLAGKIAKNAPIAVRNCKKAINDGISLPIEKAVEVEEKLFGDCFETHDQVEGMSCFLSKEKPKPKAVFTNN